MVRFWLARQVAIRTRGSRPAKGWQNVAIRLLVNIIKFYSIVLFLILPAVLTCSTLQQHPDCHLRWFQWSRGSAQQHCGCWLARKCHIPVQQLRLCEAHFHFAKDILQLSCEGSGLDRHCDLDRHRVRSRGNQAQKRCRVEVGCVLWCRKVIKPVGQWDKIQHRSLGAVT